LSVFFDFTVIGEADFKAVVAVDGSAVEELPADAFFIALFVVSWLARAGSVGAEFGVDVCVSLADAEAEVAACVVGVLLQEFRQFRGVGGGADECRDGCDAGGKDGWEFHSWNTYVAGLWRSGV